MFLGYILSFHSLNSEKDLFLQTLALRLKLSNKKYCKGGNYGNISNHVSFIFINWEKEARTDKIIPFFRNCITGRIENLYTAPTKLIEKQEQVTMLEEQLETLISNFRYVPSEGNTIEELYAYLDEYETLNSRLKALNDELSRHQRQCNPHSLGNRLIDFTFDFGITKKFFSS